MPHRSALGYVRRTGSQTTTRRLTRHVVIARHDLDHLAVGSGVFQCVSLFDNPIGVWSNEDFRLLEELAEVTPLSKTKESPNLLAE